MITYDYSGKIVLVTGGGRGLGFAIARAFLDAGAKVILNDRTEEIVARAIARLDTPNAFAAPADLARAEGAEAAVAPALQLQRLDVLVNNAAVNVERPIEQTDDAHWDLHLGVVLRAPLFTTRAALPLLSASEGSVINIASELGLHAIANNVAYVTAKHGLVALTKALAIELAPHNIRVNALCPGTMDTELMHDCARDSGDPETYYQDFRAYHPLGRLAIPEEIAAFALCLASPAAAYLTGAAIPIDGGSTAGRR
ncbi:SDR family NAD(P)-dependent oxidoreductase [Aestuariivirga sp.]|uniref:SDR family NAD(P)-dependent oxidoreductase n=1 Tax=Aestuariivirga sp. TaxID=2650926 RepID=UPI003919AFBC